MTNLSHVPSLRTLLPLFFALLLSACGNLERIATPSKNPLIGHIWDVQRQRFITRDELLARSINARYLLLGETHDNTDHHRIQADIVEALTARGFRSTLAMEQFDTEHQIALDRATAMPNVTAESVADAGQFNRKGWNWPLYEPLIALALRDKLPIAAINLSRAEAKLIIGRPQIITEESRFTTLALGITWNERRENKLRKDIVAGHCGHAPATMLPGLIAAQRARDAIMADVLINKSPAIAILGHEHARKDIGVPIYLAARVPEERSISVGLIEVEQDHINLSDYITEDSAQFDFVWFTQPTHREDPCLHMSPLRHSTATPSPADMPK